ncbi:MAG: hypothetical protein EXR72_03720 [Myxococcales bacterium]|nr:hypothetical protein [Myxococcales bacterium]
MTSPNAFVAGQADDFSTLPVGEVRLRPGERGYGRAMQGAASALGRYLVAFYDGALVPLCTLPLDPLEAQIRWREGEAAGLAARVSEGGGSGVAQRIDREALGWCHQHIDALRADLAAEQEHGIRWNSAVPHANGFYVALARLDAMKAMLGVRDPAAMAAAIGRGLDGAVRPDDGARGGMVVPGGAVQPLVEAAVLAAEEMARSYILHQHAVLDAYGDLDAPSVEGDSRERIQVLARGVHATFGSVIELAGGLTYAADLDAAIGGPEMAILDGGLAGLCEALGERKGAAEAFRASAHGYVAALARVQGAIGERRRGWLAYGEALDLRAGDDGVPDRFAALAVLAGQAEELVAMGRGVAAVLRDPAALGAWMRELSAHRIRRPPSAALSVLALTDEEFRALDDWYGQVAKFHRNVQSVGELLRSVEEAAARHLAG